MKNNLLFLLFLTFLVSSCTSVQVFEIESTQVENYENDVFAFENEDMAIAYDFWTEGGVLLFNVTNKTEESIFIDFSKSIFTINGESYDFYHDLYFPSPNIPNSSYILPPKLEEIPPQSSESIEGFPITFDWQKSKSRYQATIYGENDSPFRFSNKIVYADNENFEDTQYLENEFHVSYIEKMKRKEFRAYANNDLPKSDKFYVKRNIETHPSWFWIDVGLTIIGAVIYITD